MSVNVLVRYGRIPEVAKVQGADRRERGERVVVQTHRGLEIATVLETLKPSTRPVAGDEEEVSDFVVVRTATDEDEADHSGSLARAAGEFFDWQQRIREWNLDLQLVDLEWTLGGEKLVLYVLNDRGPECTRLAIQAAAEGFGLIEVQPVSSSGLVAKEKSGGGCGDCGCH